MKGYIIFENFNKIIECKEILDGDYTCVISDYPNGTFSGVINRVTGARCNKSDTYDFETGALIALMKMCGREKALKAVEELYFLKEPRGADLDGDILESKAEYMAKEKTELPRTLDINGTIYRKSIQIKDFGEQINKLTVDPLIEENRAFMRKCVDEWLYGPPTKREHKWEKILESHKKSNVIIVVEKEDVNSFLHEIENRIPEITWASGIKIFEAKGTIKDIYEALKTCGRIYFRLQKSNKLSYSTNPDIYLCTDFEHIIYLPPMRWDLFKKGRIYVKLDAKHFDEFKQACIRELGISPNTGYFNGEMIVINIPKEERFVITRDLKGFKARKIINWEDVR